jgi:hypothetical protein
MFVALWWLGRTILRYLRLHIVLGYLRPNAGASSYHLGQLKEQYERNILNPGAPIIGKTLFGWLGILACPEPALPLFLHQPQVFDSFKTSSATNALRSPTPSST